MAYQQKGQQGQRGTQTADRPQNQQGPKAAPDAQLPSIAQPRLMWRDEIKERFGVDKSQWIALTDAIFPNVTNVNSIILALSYCRARGLDPFKKCVHVVPIYSKERGGTVDSIWPGIGELRTTAHRTGEYAGHDETMFGEMIEQQVGGIRMKFPEYAQMTVYRFVKGQKCAFPGEKVYWLEAYAWLKYDNESPNDMWHYRPRGQLAKCAEAAALRAAFPEEIGGDFVPEEIERGATLGTIPVPPEPNEFQPAEGGNKRVGRDPLNDTLGLTGSQDATVQDAKPPQTEQFQGPGTAPQGEAPKTEAGA